MSTNYAADPQLVANVSVEGVVPHTFADYFPLGLEEGPLPLKFTC